VKLEFSQCLALTGSDPRATEFDIYTEDVRSTREPAPANPIASLEHQYGEARLGAVASCAQSGQTSAHHNDIPGRRTTHETLLPFEDRFGMPA
jgi:hypothetical protein